MSPTFQVMRKDEQMFHVKVSQMRDIGDWILMLFAVSELLYSLMFIFMFPLVFPGSLVIFLITSHGSWIMFFFYSINKKDKELVVEKDKLVATLVVTKKWCKEKKIVFPFWSIYYIRFYHYRFGGWVNLAIGDLVNPHFIFFKLHVPEVLEDGSDYFRKLFKGIEFREGPVNWLW